MMRSTRKLAWGVTIISVICNIYIFTYPSLNPEGCSWKCFGESQDINVDNMNIWGKLLYHIRRYKDDLVNQYMVTNSNYSDNRVPNIRLLALGDPQIKGNWPSTPYIKRLDTFGNDYYLGHIFNVMRKRLNPTHIAIMGDLFSSQWIGDSEFFNRTVRFTSRVCGRNDAWLYDIQNEHHDDRGLYKVDWWNWSNTLTELRKKRPMPLGFGFYDVHSWAPEREDYLIINITGNHDIGYSGDTTYQHLARFHQLLGKDSYWIEYGRNTSHSWRLVVLNNLLLEGPSLQPELIEISWEFLYQLFERKFDGSTILLTHIPFYKRAGLCSDGPEFKYYPENYDREPYKSNLLRSQNHLSEETTNRVLNLVFNNEKSGIIVTGHDHEGCVTFFSKDSKSGKWTASTSKSDSDIEIQEVTVRSMMGEYDGNSGLITGSFNPTMGIWEWHYSLCPFIIQHVWWFTKIITIISGFLWSLSLFY